MIHILEAFACGLAFAMGVNAYFYIRDLATAKGRAEIKAEWREYQKQVENRLATQVATMTACLEAIKNK